MLRNGAGRWVAPTLGLVLLAFALNFLLYRPRTLAPARAVAPDRPTAPPLSGIILVLDPGHGGADSGAARHGDCEAALTYRTAVEVAHDVRLAGGQVVFTVHSRALNPDDSVTEPPLIRPLDASLAATGQRLRLRRDDAPGPLWERAAVAAHLWRTCSSSASHALFFLSLHYDDYYQDAVHGALVCVDRRMAATPQFAKTLASSLNAAGLARRDIWHGLRGVSGRRLGVLDPRYNPVPERVLLEVATISNADDALHAANPLWRQAMAARITAALVETVRHERSAAHGAVQ